MAIVHDVTRSRGLLQDPELTERLQQLRQTDNYTNLYYLARTYVYLVAVIGGAIALYHYQQAAGWSAWWNVPVALLAIVLVGAGQHQLAGLAHEASHHILFRNRLGNELASDWLCMFPLFSSTHHYRLQHLAHHQYVNDPDLDPDVSQLRESGHWLPFPLAAPKAFWTLIRQLRPSGLVRFIAIRSRYSSMASLTNPYARKDVVPSRLAIRIGILYLLGLAGLLTGLVYYGNSLLLAIVPALFWAAAAAFYLWLPAYFYQQLRLRPVISIRWISVGRITFATLVFCGLAWIHQLSGEPAALYFLLLWIVPLATSFSYFMILRQLVQHGNAGRGWLTNTRIFLVHRFLRFSVFPMGQDYHLPHHLFATIPHYRLAQLHEMLLEYPEYRKQAVVVHGYFLPPHPTVLDVLGPDYMPATSIPAHIDDTVLEGEELDEVGST
jgi:fatty acid desaturase